MVPHTRFLGFPAPTPVTSRPRCQGRHALARLMAVSRATWPLDDSSPESFEAVETPGGRTEQRRIADEQGAREDRGTGLKQAVERVAPVAAERMRRSCRVDPLASEHVELVERVAHPRQVRKVRMQIERPDSVEELEAIGRAVDVDRRRGPVRVGRRPETETVLDRNPEPAEQRRRESTEGWSRRDGFVTVMKELGLLRALAPRQDSDPPRDRCRDAGK
jgi:hypothetical protein